MGVEPDMDVMGDPIAIYRINALAFDVELQGADARYLRKAVASRSPSRLSRAAKQRGIRGTGFDPDEVCLIGAMSNKARCVKNILHNRSFNKLTGKSINGGEFEALLDD